MDGGVGGQGMVHDKGVSGFLEVNDGHGGGGVQRGRGPLRVMAELEVVRGSKWQSLMFHFEKDPL